MKKFYLPLITSAAIAISAFAQSPMSPATKPAADNTARNARDTKVDAPTADQQPNNNADLQLVQSIRKAVINEKPLSLNAKNCKIIVNDGAVTLRGPVDSAQEKKSVAGIATRIAGAGKVTDELEVKAPVK